MKKSLAGTNGMPHNFCFLGTLKFGERAAIRGHPLTALKKRLKKRGIQDKACIRSLCTRISARSESQARIDLSMAR